MGHVSRIISLGKKLGKNGHELFFFSGGKAHQLLKREFKNVYRCTPVSWYENARGIITSASLLNIILPLPFFNIKQDRFAMKKPIAMETLNRYYDIRKHVPTIRPDLVVSDGDMHVLRLANRWNFPSVYITNVVRPSYGFSPVLYPGERFTERYVKYCSKIIIPDNPPPYTICEYNLGNLEEIGIKERVRFVGGFLDSDSSEESEEQIFVSISGPYGTRAKLAQMLIPVFRSLKIKSIISLGIPGTKTSLKVGNCEIYTWLSSKERNEFMRKSKFVVFSGGHMTCLETVKYGKPSICIPTQPEQMGNAAKLQDLGCSILAKNREQLRKAIQKMQQKEQFFKDNIAAIREFSHSFNGLDQTVGIIEGMLR
ncbi:hypothetical protein KAI12_04650 [Candidatus Bathyarchaeota archaeon]|nr:hypothetical protein [Candidatus Bathyarchaeota archaeon]